MADKTRLADDSAILNKLLAIAQSDIEKLTDPPALLEELQAMMQEYGIPMERQAPGAIFNVHAEINKALDACCGHFFKPDSQPDGYNKFQELYGKVLPYNELVSLTDDLTDKLANPAQQAEIPLVNWIDRYASTRSLLAATTKVEASLELKEIMEAFPECDRSTIAQSLLAKSALFLGAAEQPNLVGAAANPSVRFDVEDGVSVKEAAVTSAPSQKAAAQEGQAAAQDGPEKPDGGHSDSKPAP